MAKAAVMPRRALRAGRTDSRVARGLPSELALGHASGGRAPHAAKPISPEDIMPAPGDSSMERSIGAVKDRAERATREASPWIEGLGRFGYAAKGVVYLIIGVL